MIILSKMRVKKFLTIVFSFLFFFFFSSSAILAIEPSFSFFPAGGIVVDKSKGFSVDILIDTAGQEAMSAKFVVLLILLF